MDLTFTALSSCGVPLATRRATANSLYSVAGVVTGREMNQILAPFAGLFRTDTIHGARAFEGGVRWDFDEADLNECARALFRHLDQVFDILRAPGFVFLSTIELDAETGRFPDVWRSTFVTPTGRIRSLSLLRPLSAPGTTRAMPSVASPLKRRRSNGSSSWPERRLSLGCWPSGVGPPSGRRRHSTYHRCVAGQSETAESYFRSRSSGLDGRR